MKMSYLAFVATTALVTAQEYDFTGNVADRYDTNTDIVIDQRTSETVQAVKGNQEVQQDADFWGGRDKDYDWEAVTMLDGIDESKELNTWFNHSVMPFYDLHKGKVYQAAIAEAQADPDVGVLTKTCAKGTACRNEKRAALKLSLETQWKALMKNFKTSVTTLKDQSKAEIIETYKAFKQCADDNPCCTTNDVTVKNWYTSMENYQRAIYKRRIAIKELEARIKEIEVECPEILDDDYVPTPAPTPAPAPEPEVVEVMGTCYVKVATGCASMEEFNGWDASPIGNSTPWLSVGQTTQDSCSERGAMGAQVGAQCAGEAVEFSWQEQGFQPGTAECMVHVPTGCEDGLIEVWEDYGKDETWPNSKNYGWLPMWGYSANWNPDAHTFDMGWNGNVEDCSGATAVERSAGFNKFCTRDDIEVKLWYF